MHAHTMDEVQFMPVHMSVDHPAYYEGLPGMVIGGGIDMQHDHFMMAEDHHENASIFGEPHVVVDHPIRNTNTVNEPQGLDSQRHLGALAMHRSQSVMLPHHS